VPRALVIEDAQDCRVLFAYELESSGFVVLTAADGQEGLESVRIFQPDVIVLDLVLPGLSGFCVARAARSLEPTRTAIIVAVSGLTSHPLRDEALAAGCDIVLGKPIEPATIVEHACALMERRYPAASTNG
jgi:two-component system alkaline phosphatase synthesis response regulator PhoP